MSMYRKLKLQRLLAKRSQRLAPSTKRTSKGLKAALIGLLMICVSATSACSSKSSLPPEPQQVTVDASLMVPSNYTKQLLDVLSK